MANPPIKTFRSGANPAISVNIWRNQNGHHYVTLQKRYKKKDSNEWEESKFYDQRDLETLNMLIPRACAFIDHAREQQKSEPKSQPPPQNPQFDDSDIPY